MLARYCSDVIALASDTAFGVQNKKIYQNVEKLSSDELVGFSEIIP